MSHRATVIALSILMTAVLGISLLQFQNAIRAPFSRSGPAPETVAAEEAARANTLRAADTDHDTLSDYDELNVYRTSPYLEDTDSDGYTDGEEVRSNHDPNCPADKTCARFDEQPPLQPPALLAPPPEPSTFIGGGAELFERFDPVLVRTLLRGAGVPDQALQAIDDATLEQLYRASLASSTPQ